MACCAFAVYLLSQLLAPLRWLHDRVAGARPLAMRAAAAWSPMPAARAAAPRGIRRSGQRSWVRGLIAIELTAAAVVAAVATDTLRDRTAVESDVYTALHRSICRALGRPQP